MISTSVIAAVCVSLAVTALVPIALWIIFAKRMRGVSAAVLAGVLGFALSQLFIRLPVLQMLSASEVYKKFAAEHYYLLLVLLALSAALVETLGRLLVFKVLLYRRLSYDSALGAGLGHAGTESIALGASACLNNLILALTINAGALPDTVEYAEAQEALLAATPVEFIISGAERVMVIAVQIGLSVLLALFILKGKTALGALLCGGFHFALDFFAPFIYAKTGSLWASEAVVLAFAAAATAFIIFAKRLFPKINMPADEGEQALKQGY